MGSSRGARQRNRGGGGERVVTGVKIKKKVSSARRGKQGAEARGFKIGTKGIKKTSRCPKINHDAGWGGSEHQSLNAKGGKIAGGGWSSVRD